MSYEHKPNTFSLFKNDKQGNDKRPDYTGTGADADGNPIRVSAWLKDGAKGKFMSCRIEPQQERVGKSGIRQDAAKADADLDDEIPF